MGESVEVRLARLEEVVKELAGRLRCLEVLPERIGKVERARGEEGAARSAAARLRSNDEDRRARRERQFYAVGGLLLTAGNIAFSLWGH
jgi:hypothetical protein